MLSSKSSSSSPAPSPSDSPKSPGENGSTPVAAAYATGVSSSLTSRESSKVAQMSHLAARHVTNCALCVTFVAFRSSIRRAVTRVIEHSCRKLIEVKH